jgi:WD40 repeat protein
MENSRELIPMFLGSDARALALSPDSKTLAAVGWEGVVRRGVLTSRKIREAPQAHKRRLWSIAYSPDGATLALGAEPGTVLFYDADTLLPRHEDADRLGEMEVFSLAFSGDGSIIYSTGHGVKPGPGRVGQRILAEWDAATGRRRDTTPLQLLLGPTGASRLTGMPKRFTISYPPQFPPAPLTAEQATSVLGVAVSPDGRKIATVGYNLVRVWDIVTGVEVQQIRLGFERRDVRAVTFTPDGRHLVTANGNGTVFVLRLAGLE